MVEALASSALGAEVAFWDQFLPPSEEMCSAQKKNGLLSATQIHNQRMRPLSAFCRSRPAFGAGGAANW